MFSVVYCLLFTSCEQEKENIIDLTPQEILQQEFSFNSFVNTPALKKENLVIDWSSFVLRKGETSLFYEFAVKNSSTAVLNIDGYNSKLDYQLLARFNDNNQPEYFLVELLPSLDNEQKKLSYLNIMTYSGMAYLYDMNGEKISVESYEQGELQLKSLDKSIGQNLIPRTPSKCAIFDGLEPVGCNGGGNGGCSTRTVTVQHWEYFYDVEYYTGTREIISVTYSHRINRGQSTKQVTSCNGSSGGTGTVTSKVHIPKQGEELDPNLWYVLSIDDQELTGKAKCLNKLLNKTGDRFLRDLLKNFEGDSEFDVKIVSKNKVYNNNNKEVAGLTIYNVNSTQIEIQINSSSINRMSAISAVNVLLHEYIHADMFRKDNTSNPTSGEQKFRKTLDGYADSRNIYHDAMVDLYVRSMAKSLQKIHKNILTDDYNNFIREMNYEGSIYANGIPTLDFYKAIAMTGLKGTNYYSQLSFEEEQNILKHLVNDQNVAGKACPES
ncbi:hypothetical protein AWE51_14030 [Aquimarina aggregata]|uniref:Uncharacterized protein n=2 Tax=Aquimarina aggregata TaxID=1642818 RepID=A0A162XLW5_9FLAO|nr:hypothetical protein AWE51_14030 [Aquimarina aggregata]